MPQTAITPTPAESVNSILSRFESGWARGRRPRLEDLLPPDEDGRRLPLLGELIHAELELRLKAGEAARVEDYLVRFPELSEEPELVRELAGAEYQQRQRREANLDLAEYQRRFPGFDSTSQLQTNRPRPAVEAGTPQIPGYQVLQELGRGGMGVVYLARQVALKRLVALKTLPGGWLAEPDLLARFHAEAEAVAQLQHPHIVQIYEIGTTTGQPFLALEYVEGGNLAEQTHGEPQPAHDSAALVETLARAMHYAHSQGILHRDLKPANVLLTPERAPKVTDFGLAKRLDEVGQTQSGDVLGTPCYMAPEQAAGARDIGPEADVYALGTILYELLTGRPPFKAATSLETLDQVRKREPLPVRSLQPAVPRDLDTICLKCLQKDPHRRYSTAEALADDLCRFLAGQPILARPVSTAERILKWARRNPAITASLAVIAVVIATAFVLVLGALGREKLTSRELSSALEQVKEKQTEATNAATEATRQAGIAREEATQKDTARQLAEDRLLVSETVRYAQQLAMARAELQRRNPSRALELLDDCRWDLRHWEWHHLRHLSQTDAVSLRMPDLARVRGMAFSPDGQRLVLTRNAQGPGETGDVRIWDLESGQLLNTFPDQPRFIRGMVLAREGREVITVGSAMEIGNPPGELKVSDPETGQFRALVTFSEAPLACVGFSSDGATVVTAAMKDPVVHVRDVATGKDRATFRHGCPVAAVAISPDGRLVASAAKPAPGGKTPAEVRIWETETGKQVHDLSALDDVAGLAWSPDGRRLAGSGIRAGTWQLRMWHVRSGEELASLAETGSGPLTFSPDGRHLALAAGVRVRLWDTVSLQPEGVLEGHRLNVESLAFSPDGRRLATGGWGDVRVWDLAGNRDGRILFEDAAGVFRTAVSPDGRQIATADGPGGLKVWDAATGNLQLAIRADIATLNALAWSPDGKRILSGSQMGIAQVWDAGSGARLAAHRHQPDGPGRIIPVLKVAYSPDGKLVASATGTPTRDGMYASDVTVWDPATGEVRNTFPGHQGEIKGLTFRPDGRQVASAGTDRYLRIWDLTVGREVMALGPHAGGVDALAYDADGKRLAGSITYHSPYGDREPATEIKVWNVADAKELTSLRRAGASPRTLLFSGDGQRLIAAGPDEAVRMWDLAAGMEMFTFPTHIGGVSTAWLSPDATTLITSGGDRRVRRWDAPSRLGPRVLKEVGSFFNDVALDPKGEQLATAGGRLVRLWDVRTGRAVREIDVGVGKTSLTAAFSPDARWLAIGVNTGEAQVHEITTGRLIATRKHASAVLRVAFSPDGLRVASADQRDLAVWDRETGQQHVLFRATPTWFLTRLRFSSDGRKLIGAVRGTVKAWDAETGRELFASSVPGSQSVGAVALEKAGRLTAYVSGDRTGGVYAWDLDSGREVLARPDLSSSAYGAAFSPDGRLLAVGGKELELWDLAAGHKLASLPDTPRASRIDFSPDGRTLVCLLGGRLVHLWDVQAALQRKPE